MDGSHCTKEESSAIIVAVIHRHPLGGCLLLSAFQCHEVSKVWVFEEVAVFLV